MIAYYFPPMGGSGVQRPLKFAKYLKKFGWEPIVLAPEPGMYHTFDDSLLQEAAQASIRIERVENSAIFQPGKKKRSAKPKGRLLSFFIKWITSWFFLPDNKKGWIEPAVERGLEIINKETIHAIFSTAPPYSNLIIAHQLKNKTGLPVVMDLRDDWLGSHWISYPTRWHYRKMKNIEKQTLSAADAITVVNDTYNKKIKKRLGENSPPIQTIPNGYDKENFRKAIPARDRESFTILHSGLFYDRIKPDSFLKSIKKLMVRDDEFRKHVDLQFQGGLRQTHWKMINQLGLTKYVTDFGYLNHQDAVQNLVNADLLFLTLGKIPGIDAVTPGKVFEYMGSLKPILAYVPDGITKKLLENYGAATVVGIESVDMGADAIQKYFLQWKAGKLPSGDINYTLQFEREFTAKQLSEICDNVGMKDTAKSNFYN
ncbi:glycosyltransferase [Rhodohalobacter sp. SW132]|nr:glycosyltransferase [Rhodohalobacter sp. SW132]